MVSDWYTTTSASKDFNYDAIAHLMASQIQILASPVPNLADQALDQLRQWIKPLAFYEEDSELSHLNRSSKKEWKSVSPLLFEVLRYSKILEQHTGGLFRVDFEGIKNNPQGRHGFQIKFPNWVWFEADTQINLGGIGKGFLVDKLFRFIKQNGAKRILVNAGGDMRIQSEDRKKPWNIGMNNPFDLQGKPPQTLKLTHGAVATSAIDVNEFKKNKSYQSPFYNPKLRQSLHKPAYFSVTVTGRFAGIAEVYAKYLLMGGDSKILKRGYRAWGVLPDQSIEIIA